MNFWDKNTEINFFEEALKNFASLEQLFYRLSDGYFAYAPKGKSTEKQTLQSRNALIGRYTEKWCKNFFEPIAQKLGLFAVSGVVCEEIGLTTKSNADLAFCITNKTHQKAENIKLLFEIKMSIVNNYHIKNNQFQFLGNYTTHKGNPSILRSDSMLKAIGKSINIRVSGANSNKIPILIIGNSPITKNYANKVDFLKKSGVVQGFLSVYPNPAQSFIKDTQNKGFQTFDDYLKLQDFIVSLIASDMYFFSSMLPKKELGKIIKTAAKENFEIKIAEKFLQLLNHPKKQ